MQLGIKKKQKKTSKKLGHTPGCKTETATMGKHYKGRSKKHLSEKQKKSLAKGRKILSYLRTGRTAAEPLEPILIKEGRFMSKATAIKSKSSKKHSLKGTYHHRRRKHHTLHGAGSDFDAIGILSDIGGLMAGGIVISFLAALIPVKNAKLKTLLPIAAGLIGISIPALSKYRFLNRAALGSLAIGSYSLTKQSIPQIPLMGSTDTAEAIGYAIQALPQEEQAILGLLTDKTATPQEQPEYSGNQPGDMLGSNAGEMLGETELIDGLPGEMLGSEETEMLTGGTSTEDFE